MKQTMYSTGKLCSSLDNRVFTLIVEVLEIEQLVEVLPPPNGHAVQLRPTALTVNAGARRPPPECYY